MSYFKNLLDAVKTKLPMLIKEVVWDGTMLHMGGTKWNYNAMADWVMVNNEVMIIGCHDDNIQTFIKEQIVGTEIIDLLPSLDLPSYDPIFVLTNNVKMKFFSTSGIEPWTFKFDDNYMFVASPSDAKWVVRNF